MFAKVHPAEDVKSGNTGSCHDLVRYLEKETGEGQRFFPIRSRIFHPNG